MCIRDRLGLKDGRIALVVGTRAGAGRGRGAQRHDGQAAAFLKRLAGKGQAWLEGSLGRFRTAARIEWRRQRRRARYRIQREEKEGRGDGAPRAGADSALAPRFVIERYHDRKIPNPVRIVTPAVHISN